MTEILDSTRIHPFESYEFARKIAMDAMNAVYYGDEVDEMNLPTKEAASKAIAEAS